MIARYPVGLGAPLRQLSGQIRVFPTCCAVHLGGMAQVGRRIRDFRLFPDLVPLFEILAEPLLGIAQANCRAAISSPEREPDAVSDRNPNLI